MNAVPSVVLDMNILVAAGFNKQSSAAQIIRAVRAGKLRLVWHPQIRAETKKIIRQIPPLSWARFEDLFSPEGKFNGPIAPEEYSAISDPGDRKFAALAAAADAILVSNDRHLLAVRDRLSITVMSSNELVRRQSA